MEDANLCTECGRPVEGKICPHCAIRSAIEAGRERDGKEAKTELAVADGTDLPEDVKRFGPYSVIRKLGEGGFGIVYLALQTKPIRRHVALKVLKKGICSGKHLLARFELEQQALARMDHPSICRVYDAGESADGEPYFAMEVVDGKPITKYCREAHLPLSEILALFSEVCSAVDHANQRGVIHRDLKPSNILIVERDGKPHPVVIDFGIAKAMEPLLETDTILTMSFQIIGTPAYMSPEQAESGGHDADVRSDVYSLGTILYELLTGTPPISTEELQKAGIAAALGMIRNADTVPPSSRITHGGEHESKDGRTSHTSTIPARRLRGDLDWITMRALAKERGRRYQTPRELADDLDRFSIGMPVLAGPPGLIYRCRKFVRRHPAGVAVFAVAALAGISWLVAGELSSAADARLAKERLLVADQPASAFAIGEAGPHIPRIRDELEDVSSSGDQPLQVRINATLALATADESKIPALCAFFLGEGGQTPSADQAQALQSGVLKNPNLVPAKIAWDAEKIARDVLEPQKRRLSAVALLAVTNPDGSHWEKLAPEVAHLVCGAGTVNAIRWAPVLKPVAKHLLDPVEEVFANEGDSLPGMCAAVLLGEFRSGDAQGLAKLAVSGTSPQFEHLSAAFLNCGDECLPAAAAVLEETEVPDSVASEEEKDRLALRRAKAVMLMLLTGQGKEVWPLLVRAEWGDPRVRTFIIHSFADCGISPMIPFVRLESAEIPSERAALLLALGRYKSIEVGPGLFESASERAREIYQSDGSAEVHSAAEWMLRNWEREVNSVAREFRPEEDRTWFLDPVAGVKFVTFQGPVKYLMGSPESEPGRDSNEFQHEAEIKRGFCLSVKPLTVEQVNRILPKTVNGDLPGDFPAHGISWNTARRLCNALSRKAGIPEEQWCYSDDEEPVVKSDLTAYAGYRLATEVEWEYAGRGGSSAPRYYGYAEDLLSEYACYFFGDGGGMRPTGTRIPNGFGLFDMLGNVQYYVEGPGGPYPGDTVSAEPTPGLRIGLSDGTYAALTRKPLRGQTGFETLRNFRSAKRFFNLYPAHVAARHAGIRLARTLPTDDVNQTQNTNTERPKR